MNECPPAAAIIDITMAIDIFDDGTLSFFDNERIDIEAFKCTHGGIHAAGDDLARFFVNFL